MGFGDTPSKYWLPNAMQENSWQLWLASLLYLVSALFALVEAVRAALDRRGLKSFRFHFLTASFLFGTVRGVLTLVYISTWADHLFLLYFFGLFFPQFLQFWVFSLLVLFVVRMVMSMNGQESAVTTVLYPLYNFLLCGLMLAVVLFSYFLAQNLAGASGDAASEWDKAAATWNMCLYFFLALVGGYYCYRCYVLFTSAIQLDQQNKHRRTYLIVIVVFFVIFMLRFLWCFLYSINANPIQNIIEEWIKSDQEDKFNSAFLCFYFLFEIMPTYMVVIAFRSPSSEPVAYTLTIKGGVNGASGSGANSNASSAPGTPRAGLRYGSIGAGGGGMVAPALAPGAQYYQPSPHHGYLGDALLADPTVTLITPPASNPASPSPHTPLLAPAAGRAASSASGRWNEIAVKSAGGVNRVADDEVETLDLSQYQ